MKYYGYKTLIRHKMCIDNVLCYFRIKGRYAALVFQLVRNLTVLIINIQYIFRFRPFFLPGFTSFCSRESITNTALFFNVKSILKATRFGKVD